MQATRRPINTTVSPSAWTVFRGLVDADPYPADTDVVSAALVYFGHLDRTTQLHLIAAVREEKRKAKKRKR